MPIENRTGGHPNLKLQINGDSGKNELAAVKVKTKRRDKSDLGDNFVAPDGGWGWIVALTTGFATLFTFAMMQQFGIIFRARLTSLGISSSEMTTIINTQTAVSACTGLINGPMFRRFTFRQVALAGGTLTFIGLFFTAFADSFMFYMVTIAVLYGIGRGFMVSASSLALNTYFKVNRRKATAYQFTVAGLGPMFLPYLSTFLLQTYGVQGTVLVFSGLSLNTIACALTFQPVRWHTMKQVEEITAVPENEEEKIEEEELPVTTDPETPIMTRANDGWYGSKMSLNSSRYYRRSSSKDIDGYLKFRRSSSKDVEAIKLSPIAVNNNSDNNKFDLKKTSYMSLNKIKEQEEISFLEKTDSELEEEEREKLPFYQKLILFFDLDLMKDFTYLCLVIGLTMINFTEINFAVLTPFILSEFGYSNAEIAMAMSMLATTDILVRFLIPCVVGKMNVNNQLLFVLAVMGMSVGRMIICHASSFNFVLFAFGFMGACKGVKVVFWQLIIPGHVPLKRLPAAAGLQLLISGIFTLAFGPVIGLITDASNYTVTLYCLNGLNYLAAILWLFEGMTRKYRRKAFSEPTTATEIKS